MFVCGHGQTQAGVWQQLVRSAPVASPSAGSVLSTLGLTQQPCTLHSGRACPRHLGPSLLQGGTCAPGASAPAHSGRGGEGAAAQRDSRAWETPPAPPLHTRKFLPGHLWPGPQLLPCGLSSRDGSRTGQPWRPLLCPQHPSDLALNLQMFLEAGQSLSDRRQEQCSPAALGAKGVEALVWPATTLSPGGPHRGSSVPRPLREQRARDATGPAKVGLPCWFGRYSLGTAVVSPGGPVGATGTCTAALGSEG